MWLFTTRGFFSIVEKWDDAQQLQVRARVRSDLDELRELCPALGPTIELGRTDYPYRAYVAKTDFAPTLSQLILDLSYRNFKDAVEERQGRARHDLYSEVWSVMYNAEQKLAKMREPEDSASPLSADELDALDWVPVRKQHR